MIAWMINLSRTEAWFITLTFKDYKSVDAADKLKKKWLARLAEAIRCTGRGRLYWVSASEWQKRDVIHFHVIAVADGLGSISRKRWEYRWEAMSKGFARIYEAVPKAAPYLAKYTRKSLGGELQWGESWRRLKTPDSVSCCSPISHVKRLHSRDSRAKGTEAT